MVRVECIPTVGISPASEIKKGGQTGSCLKGTNWMRKQGLVQGVGYGKGSRETSGSDCSSSPLIPFNPFLFTGYFSFDNDTLFLLFKLFLMFILRFLSCGLLYILFFSNLAVPSPLNFVRAKEYPFSIVINTQIIKQRLSTVSAILSTAYSSPETFVFSY